MKRAQPTGDVMRLAKCVDAKGAEMILIEGKVYEVSEPFLDKYGRPYVRVPEAFCEFSGRDDYFAMRFAPLNDEEHAAGGLNEKR